MELTNLISKSSPMPQLHTSWKHSSQYLQTDKETLHWQGTLPRMTSGQGGGHILSIRSHVPLHNKSKVTAEEAAEKVKSLPVQLIFRGVIDFLSY